MNQDKKILAKFNLIPSKKLGQNFLTNSVICSKIAELINIKNYDNLVEIGPGLGAITSKINYYNKKFLAIELDKRLFEFLTSHFVNEKEIQIINDDILKFNISNHFYEDQKVLLFGNIPYSISSKIIKKFLETKNYHEAILMVQKEYFDRLIARENNKSYSSFSVFVQAFCSIEKKLLIDKKEFYPTPKIDSIIFSLTKKRNPKISDTFGFSKFVQNCFQMKRKKIVNNLKNLFIDSHDVLLLLEKTNIDFNCRPDAISVEQYENLFLNYQEFKIEAN